MQPDDSRKTFNAEDAKSNAELAEKRRLKTSA
jgi:hypothetical protein